jgi:hypothetical protein
VPGAGGVEAALLLEPRSYVDRHRGLRRTAGADRARLGRQVDAGDGSALRTVSSRGCTDHVGERIVEDVTSDPGEEAMPRR